MMSKEFIPYEEALALKELGFKEMCMRLYVNGRLSPQVDEGQFNHDWDIVSAPLYQQAFRWFRDKYDEHHTWRLQTILSVEDYETYEEAELVCLRKLIELLKSKEDVSLLGRRMGVSAAFSYQVAKEDMRKWIRLNQNKDE